MIWNKISRKQRAAIVQIVSGLTRTFTEKTAKDLIRLDLAIKNEKAIITLQNGKIKIWDVNKTLLLTNKGNLLYRNK